MKHLGVQVLEGHNNLYQILQLFFLNRDHQILLHIVVKYFEKKRLLLCKHYVRKLLKNLLKLLNLKSIEEIEEHKVMQKVLWGYLNI